MRCCHEYSYKYVSVQSSLLVHCMTLSRFCALVLRICSSEFQNYISSTVFYRVSECILGRPLPPALLLRLLAAPIAQSQASPPPIVRRQSLALSLVSPGFARRARRSTIDTTHDAREAAVAVAESETECRVDVRVRAQCQSDGSGAERLHTK